MSKQRPDLIHVRAAYAVSIAREAGCAGTPVQAAFAAVPREDFLPPPPWRIYGHFRDMRTDNPEDLYCDALVAIDPLKGINNGQPSLHARWLAAVSPQPGEHVLHIGCGGGYYTAMLARLVSPGGQVDAYEIDQDIAGLAVRSLRTYRNVTVQAVSGASGSLPQADVLYVNAAASAPQSAWLDAMRPGARLIFPWNFAERSSASMLITRNRNAARPVYRARVTGLVTFIAMEDEQEHGAKPVSATAIEDIRALVPKDIAAPDGSAVAEFSDYWFSSQKPSVFEA
ncbi:MAG: SAM-dependent methyltransferase [Hyphomicrobiales bacterium]|nr:SAM-dependent methyltransferase [Hyphomicrobiales bacterium]